MEPTTETDEVSTTESTEDTLPIDGAKVNDGRIGKLMSRNVSNKTRRDWGYKPRQVDDGEHWVPPAPPYRRG